MVSKRKISEGLTFQQNSSLCLCAVKSPLGRQVNSTRKIELSSLKVKCCHGDCYISSLDVSIGVCINKFPPFSVSFAFLPTLDIVQPKCITSNHSHSKGGCLQEHGIWTRHNLVIT